MLTIAAGTITTRPVELTRVMPSSSDKTAQEPVAESENTRINSLCSLPKTPGTYRLTPATRRTSCSGMSDIQHVAVTTGFHGLRYFNDDRGMNSSSDSGSRSSLEGLAGIATRGRNMRSEDMDGGSRTLERFLGNSRKNAF